MKYAFVILCALAVAALPAMLPASGEPFEIQVVRDAANRFTLSIPSTWQVKVSKGDPAVLATSPAENGTAPDSLSVIARNVIGMSSESCEHEAAHVVRYFLHIRYTTVREGPMAVGDLTGYSHIYTWRARTGEEQWSLQVCLVTGHQAFVMTGTTKNTPPRVDESSQILTHIIQSFRPTPPGNSQAAPEPQTLGR